MARKLLIGAAVAMLLGAVAAPPSQAQRRDWQRELHRLKILCDDDYKPACIRFGMIIGMHRGRIAEWRREHPDWWWWQPWIEH